MTLWAACDALGNCRQVQWNPEENGPQTTAVTISAAVGAGGANKSHDVQAIQQALNRVEPAEGGPSTPLAVDGFYGPQTGQAIRQFQRHHFSGWQPDGRIDPGQKTLRRLNEILGGGDKQAFKDPAQAGLSQDSTSADQIAQAFALATDALGRVRRAIHRLTAVRSAYTLPNPLFGSESEKRLVQWHFKVHRADNPVLQIDRVRQVYQRMEETLSMALRGGSAFRLFQAGQHPDKSAIAYAHWGGYDFALDEKEGGEQGKYIYITSSFRTASSSVIIHELGHYCGGRKGSQREIGHIASPSPWPNGQARDDSKRGHNYAQLTADEAYCNTYSYQVYAFPEFKEHKVPDFFR